MTMISPLQPSAKSRQRSPLSGINWSELGAAYRAFLSDPATGILHILAAGRHSQWQRWVERRLEHQAAHLAYRTIAVDLGALVQLPPDTLGGAYACHMLRYGFNPEVFRTDEASSEWLRQRMAISHDIYHIYTGFDASPIGEFGVAAYTLVQYRDLLNVFVLSFVPLSLTNPLWTVPLLRAMVRGFRMGMKGRAAIAYPPELNWEKPLAIVRQELGLEDFFKPC
ncbi:Coq4 family protein [Leptolyngbya sp. CCNP1308]|uniref:Coq4 family protein n=1 Tax=Leptolyngbya sp. CCNP1308 TaxID=3110255 RepID=UPI002B1F7604|nr:Coq4 family protein [Leptolyngbya sp. CCNP1308]MEA5447349.1 Coq4 family protein [Leptolyngbya sp. CCNP1308]